MRAAGAANHLAQHITHGIYICTWFIISLIPCIPTKTQLTTTCKTSAAKASDLWLARVALRNWSNERAALEHIALLESFNRSPPSSGISGQAIGNTCELHFLMCSHMNMMSGDERPGAKKTRMRIVSRNWFAVFVARGALGVVCYSHRVCRTNCMAALNRLCIS